MRTLLVIAVLGIAACGGSDVSREVGARCDDDSECDDRCLGPHPNWPDGFCTLSCDDDSDCPSDAACILEEGGACVFTCTGSDLDCDFLGPTWTCQTRNHSPDGTVMVCRGE